MKKLEEHREFARTIVAMQHQVIDWVREGRREEAIDLMVMEASPAQIEALKTLDQLTDMEEQKSKVLIAGARAAFDKTMRDVGATAILGSLFCLIVGMVVSFKFSDFIPRPGGRQMQSWSQRLPNEPRNWRAPTSA